MITVKVLLVVKNEVRKSHRYAYNIENIAFQDAFFPGQD